MRTIFALSLLAAALAPTAHADAQQTPAMVVFSEIMWMGSDASSADEWIELYNRGDEPVNLEGWTIRRVGDGEETVMVTIESGVIEPGATFLIANYSHESSRSHLAHPVQFVSAAVSLPNSQLLLRLYDQPEGGTLMDAADDGSGRPFGGSTEPPAAMVRETFDMDGTQAAAWSTATTSSGWRPGSSELGTPGSLPPRLQPAVEDRTTGVSTSGWSHVKLGHLD